MLDDPIAPGGAGHRPFRLGSAAIESETTTLGAAIARRSLELVLIVDVSGSMASDGKIQALNTAVREAVPQLQAAARENPHVRLLIRVLAFASDPGWHVAEPTPIDEFRWRDLAAVPEGLTEMGAALQALLDVLTTSDSGRNLPAALVLLSDGRPTDTRSPSFLDALEALRTHSATRVSVRVAIGIGRDVDLAPLAAFMGGGEPLHAANPQQLIDQLRFVSAAAVEQASISAT